MPYYSGTSSLSPQTPAAAPAGRANSLRTPALVAGGGLLLMAVLGMWANFVVVEALLADEGAARTAQNILASERTVWLGVVSLFLVAALDVAVAWGLWAFFAPVHAGLSRVAAGLRVVYAGVFAFAILRLASAVRLVTDSARPSGPGAQPWQVEALERIDAFHLVWDMGYVLFGLHLVIVGYLAYRSRYAPRVLGGLVAVAGVGYLVDSLGSLLAPGALPQVGMVTFVGEVFLLVWLLVRGRRATIAGSGSRVGVDQPHHPERR